MGNCPLKDTLTSHETEDLTSCCTMWQTTDKVFLTITAEFKPVWA